VLLSPPLRCSAKPCAGYLGGHLPFREAWLDETALADANEPGQRERLRMVPVDLRALTRRTNSSSDRPMRVRTSRSRKA